MRIRLNLAIAYFATALLAASSAGEAAAKLAFSNIQGSWCGTQSKYVFTTGTLSVTHFTGGFTKVLRVDRYDYADSMITLYYLAQDPEHGGTPGTKTVWVAFGEFSANGKTMVQLANKNGPRRPFHRC